MTTPRVALPDTTDCGPPDRQAEMLAGFQGTIPPVTAPLSYRLAILLVTVVMVLLPLVYVALIALVGYGVYYHTVNHTAMLHAVSGGRAQLMAFLVYLSPLVIGGILVLFMFKPLFSRPADRHKGRSLERAQEPLLFAFVERLCEVVGAPKPRQIDIDGNVNASAGFRRGLWSMLGNDLVLTIGVPLVAGLNLRQFAGVLAHEFGHFSQGAGLRLTYVIRSISFWFTRVVYERDEWDQKLVEWSGTLDVRVGWVLYAARFFVWLTRKVLWLLMMVGHAVSAYLLRQMELDADRHEARLAGSDTFEATARRLVVLNIAYQNAEADLGSFYQEGRLADNLPRLILANVDQFSPDVLAKIDQVVDKSSTGWFDTHPSDRERIASAHRENAGGVFRLGEPASVLFADFDRTAREVTLDYYQHCFGTALKQEEIHPVEELIARQGQETESYKALRRYLQDTFSALRPLDLSQWTLDSPDNPQEWIIQLKNRRAQMLTELSKYQEAYKEFDEADSRLLAADQAAALLSGGLNIGKTDFPVPLTSWSHVTQIQNSCLAQQKQQEAQLAAFESVATERLLTALQLLGAATVALRIEKRTELQVECQSLMSALSVLESQVGPLTELRNALANLGILFRRVEGHTDRESVVAEIRKWLAATEHQVCAIRDKLTALAYPFSHAKKGISIGEYALSQLPNSDDAGAIAGAADALVRNLTRLRARMIGRLCQIAELVESQLGLEPLAEPVVEKAEG